MPRKKPGRRAAKASREMQVCKPCWELHYCPYGPLVEHFPSPTEEPIASIKQRYEKVLGKFGSGRLKTEEEILDAIDVLEYHYPARWEYIRQFSQAEMQCRIFGHICPVFFAAEGATETKEGRRWTRSIPRGVMLQVVRRDGQICQICHTPVADDELQFDHIIPHSRGGPATAANLRVVHKRCNAKRRDSVDDIIES